MSAPGVATLSYLPYAILNIVSPMITIAFADLSVRMMRSGSPPADARNDAGGAAL